MGTPNNGSNPVFVNVSEPLSVFMRQKGLKPADVADKTGFTIAEVEAILVGKHKLDLKDASTLAFGLTLTLQDLCGDAFADLSGLEEEEQTGVRN